jgi:preprotein translocase subunit SecF
MKQFSFMKFRWLYFSISAVAIIPGLIFLALYGLRLSIDFTGGSLLDVKYQQKQPAVELSRERIQEIIGQEPNIISVQSSGTDQFIVRMPEISNEQKEQLLNALRPQFASIEERRFETVGPVLGRELFEKTFIAVVIVSLGIILYVGKQFHSVKYGVCAVLAMFHDSIVLIGAFAIFGKLFHAEVDVLFVTALLTTLSFSVHDTIVVFDRIRENRKKHPTAEYETLIDASVLETLGRSINNSMTIIIMLLVLVLLGGDTIRWFAVALLVGAVTGTFSSTFTAAPLLLVWDEFQHRRKLRK